MNPPATVKGMQRLKAFLVIAIALAGLEIPAAASERAHSDSIKSVPSNDGVYLYGETPQPNRVGKGYVVFQQQQGEITGAFYYPSSEFTCFSGFLTNDTLGVKTDNPGKQKTPDVEIKLADLHRIKTVSDNDQRILSACKQETVALTEK